MLNLIDASSPSSRRSFLKFGTTCAGLFGVSSPWSRILESAEGKPILKDRSVVFLNLQGGPTQFETFDPKVDAPREIRSIGGEIPTTLPGVTFSACLPRLAKLAHRMAVLRSYRHGISDHDRAAKHVMAGGNVTKAMMGSLYARVAGLSNPSTGLPSNVLVTPSSVGEQYKKLYHARSRVSQVGSLPGSYKPLDPSAGAEIVDNMELRIDKRRFGDRRHLLERLDRLRREVESSTSGETLVVADRFREQAFDVLLRGVREAFDVSKEDPATVARYDTGSMEPTDGAKNRNEYAKMFSPIALGHQLLMARRLAEAGSRFVTVTCGGWDMHGGGKEFTMRDGLDSLTPAVDKAVSAFIEDVDARGLSEKILLVITGEFGRTPKINKNGGRDHWGHLCPIVFVGGGFEMGQVIGQSDKTGSAPTSTPISSAQVRATILHALLDLPEVRVQTNLPQEVQDEVTASHPIAELIG